MSAGVLLPRVECSCRVPDLTPFTTSLTISVTSHCYSWSRHSVFAENVHKPNRTESQLVRNLNNGCKVLVLKSVSLGLKTVENLLTFLSIRVYCHVVRSDVGECSRGYWGPPPRQWTQTLDTTVTVLTRETSVHPPETSDGKTFDGGKIFQGPGPGPSTVLSVTPVRHRTVSGVLRTGTGGGKMSTLSPVSSSPP